MTLIGAIAAFAVSAPFVARGRASSRDITAAVAAGSLLGPLGGLAAVILAALICVVQRSPGRQPAATDRFAPRPTHTGASFEQCGRSILAIIENRRLRKDPGSSVYGGAGSAGGSDAARHAGVEIIPWRTSLAVATLAALMTGIFI